MTTRNPSIRHQRDPAAPPMSRIQAYNVVGTFPNPPQAQQAIQQLRDRGYGVGDAALLGEAEDLQPTKVGLSASDHRVARGVTNNVVRCAVGGAILLAAIGVVLVLIPGVRSAMGTTQVLGPVLVALFVGAIVGAVIGGYVGYVTGVDRNVSGQEAYDDQIASGPVVLGIKADGDAAVQRARGVLTELGATDVSDIAPMQRGDG
jgi:hypothetical protein